MARQKQKNALDKRIRSRKKSVCSARSDYVIVLARLEPRFIAQDRNSQRFTFEFCRDPAVTRREPLAQPMRKTCDGPALQ